MGIAQNVHERVQILSRKVLAYNPNFHINLQAEYALTISKLAK